MVPVPQLTITGNIFNFSSLKKNHILKSFKVLTASDSPVLVTPGSHDSLMLLLPQSHDTQVLLTSGYLDLKKVKKTISHRYLPIHHMYV